MSAQRASRGMDPGAGSDVEGQEMETDITPLDDPRPEDEPTEETQERGGGEPERFRSATEEKAPPAAELPADEALPRVLEDLRVLRGERDRLYDAWLRTTADFDNYRKRIDREREEFRQYAVESLILQILPVLDNFERALGTLPAGLQRGFADGVGLIHKQLQDTLARQGVTAIETDGSLFDPHLHEAVETETRTDLQHHSILCERQRGYRLGKRVLRPSRVKVSVRPDEGEHASDDDGEAGPEATS